MIIQIKSKNDFLADVLHKNPDTDHGLYLAPLKKGVVAGNIVSKHQYDVLFQDSKYSYLPEESNAIDFQSYCSPLVILDMCTILFAHLLKSKEDVLNKNIAWLSKSIQEVDTEECVIEVPNFFIDSSWSKNKNFLLVKYFPQLNVEHKTGNNYHLTIKAKSIFEAMNLLCIISMFVHVTNDYGIFTYIDDYFSQKYSRILCNVDKVPYFVFYLFIIRTVKNDQQFDNVKLPFEKYLACQGLECELTSYRTHEARLRCITSLIDPIFPVLDVGCGELIYYRRLRSLKYSNNYYAVDEDASFGNLASNLKDRYGDDSLHFFTSLDELPTIGKCNIILSEVIEHNSKEEAKSLINKLLKFEFNQLIITTPNCDFNKYYDEDMERRHDDHDFEMGSDEFQSFIQDIFKNENSYNYVFSGIGDKVDGIQPTQVCVIKLK